MTVPLLRALTWDLVPAVLFVPVHQWLEQRKLTNRNFAAILIGLIVLVPVLCLGPAD